MHYNKLIRDKIPEIIEKKGEVAHYRIASDSEYKEALKQKLLEEVSEFLENPCEEEAADILEVLHAIAANIGKQLNSIEQVRKEKLEKRGGFKKRIILLETEQT